MRRRVVGCVICSVCGRRRTAYKTSISGLRAFWHGHQVPNRNCAGAYQMVWCEGSWKEGAIMNAETLRGRA